MVGSAIETVARAEGVPVAVRHVCIACSEMLGGATGVGLSLIGGVGLCEPLYATDTASEAALEAEASLGEGPGAEALAAGRPVLVSDLTSETAGRRWPTFVPAALATGTKAVFAFPLVLGAISVGALEFYRGDIGRLSDTEFGDALLFSDAATLRALDHLSGKGVGEFTVSGSDIEYRWGEVHQATGVLSVQLNSSLAEALLRLRGHAYLTGRRLSEVARDVLAGSLRLDRDSGGGPGSES